MRKGHPDIVGLKPATTALPALGGYVRDLRRLAQLCVSLSIQAAFAGFPPCMTGGLSPPWMRHLWFPWWPSRQCSPPGTALPIYRESISIQAMG